VGALPVETPRVEAWGEIDGWPYLVETRLRDRTLEAVWGEMDDRARLSIAAELGKLVAALHAVPTDGLPDDWERFVAEGVAGCVARHRAQGADARWLTQIPDFLAGIGSLAPAPRRAIVTGDVHDGHLTASDRSGRWRLTGLFDFDDAQVGDPEFDLAATGLIVLAGRPALLRTFLSAYGYGDSALDDALSRRLLAHTLLHRYRPMTWWLPSFVPDPPPGTLEEIATAIYDWRA
jgi:hygromycin-B 7''-O-kinase